MKKQILNLVLTLSVTLGSLGVLNNKAEAMIVTTGGISTAAFAVFALSFSPAYLQHASGNPTRMTSLLYGIASAAFLLDKDSNALTFKVVANGREEGLSDEEVKAFNSEIDRINGAVQEAILNSTEQLDTEKFLGDIAQELSPEAFSALRKISDNAANRAAKK